MIPNTRQPPRSDDKIDDKDPGNGEVMMDEEVLFRAEL